MEAIKKFNHPQFGEIRAMKMSDGQVVFVGKEVATILGYANPLKAIRDHVDEEDKGTERIVHPSGGAQQTITVNESGLYSLILSSKLPQAREFKHWVTSEVLPQIRQTGGYIPMGGPSGKEKGEGRKEKSASDTEIMARALMIAQRTIELKDKLLEAQKQKVLFADAVTSQEDSILISEMAKLLTQNGYEIGRTRFFNWLRENGYLFKHSTEPIQKWVERGIFDTTVSLIHTNHGQREAITTKVTGKGQRYFIEGFTSGRFHYKNGEF